MRDADLRIKQWCIEELQRAERPLALDLDVLVGHYQIDGIHRKGCPGAAWPKQAIYDALAPAGPEQLMIPANGLAPYFTGRTFEAATDKQVFWVSRDYNISAARPRMARIDVELEEGSMVFWHGHDTSLYAYSISTYRQEKHASLDVMLDANGDCFFSASAGTRIRWIGILGYWK
jgi:hypothetical protein